MPDYTVKFNVSGEAEATMYDCEDEAEARAEAELLALTPEELENAKLTDAEVADIREGY